jgi:hypothetical protein
LHEVRETALDVGIASLDAQCAGADCLATLRRRKLRCYAAYDAELTQSGVVYLPLPWSCYGREHADTSSALVALARRAARRLGRASHLPLLAKVRAGIGVALARRAARMVLRCLEREGGSREEGREEGRRGGAGRG